MSKVVQFRRGTTVEHAAFTGAAGEVTVDTDKKVVVVHDGATAGGIPMARDDEKANQTLTDAGDYYTVKTPEGALQEVGSRLIDKANSTAIAPAYNPTSTYALGATCTHLGTRYKCTTAITVAEAWTAGHWTEEPVQGALDEHTSQLAEIVSGAAKGGPTLTLIETITVPAGGLSAIERTKKPGGDNYAFDTVVIKSACAAGSAQYTAAVYIYVDAALYVYTQIAGYVDTAARYTIIRAYKQNGFWFAESSDPNTSSGNVQAAGKRMPYNNYMTRPAGTNPKIQRISINTTLIPEGSVVEIWGV